MGSHWQGNNGPSLVILEGVKHLRESGELGRGAYGVVYKVQYKGKVYAGKKIHSILVEADSPSGGGNAVLEAFRRECEHCSTLHHKNIVDFLGICYPTIHAKVPVLVMEMMDESLTTFINRKAPMEVTFSTRISILLDIARGLSYLHSQQPPVVHRDLSPNNILLKGSTKPGAIMVAKIGDLGVAKLIKVDNKETLTKAPGTVAFMSPEATAERPVYGAPLDVFSYGGIMLFVATHKWPTPANNTRMDSFSGKLVAFTEVERRQRYLDEMTEEMEALKPLVESCFHYYPSKRPAIEDIPAHLEPLKAEASGSHADYIEWNFDKKQKEAPKPHKISVDDTEACTRKKKMASTQKQSTSHLWYVGNISSSKAETMVQDLFDGVYLVRENNESRGEYEICIKWKGKPYHVVIYVDPKTNNFYLTKEKMFSTIYELVNYYEQNSLTSAHLKVATKLKCAYHIVEPSTKSPDKRPWPISSKAHPPSVNTSTLPKKAPEPCYDDKSKSLLRRFGDMCSSLKMTSKTDKYATGKIESPYVCVNDPREGPWYHGEISRADAVKLLTDDGDYLVRFSSNESCYVLTAMCNGEPKHFIIREKKKGGFGYSFCGLTFPSISDLLEHYADTPIPVNQQSQILKKPICKQVDNNQYFLHHDNLIRDEKPFHKGSRCFVYFATIQDSGREVAVKICCADKQQFVHEAKLLQQFKHPNIVKLLNISIDGDPTYVVLEMMSGGDFQTFLRTNGSYQTQYQLTKFSLDAALGMEYLASQNCLHRNLTTRSCLLGNNNEVLKISDFSMCTMAESGICYDISTVKNIAIKWMAPEVFEIKVYTTASDVWSFGVMLYEIYSWGKVPYFDISNMDLFEHLNEGHRLNAPESTPAKVYSEVMWKCWYRQPKERPTFNDITAKLTDILAELQRR